MLREAVAVPPPMSVTLATKERVVAVVGVPAMVPVPLMIHKPAVCVGQTVIEPDCTDQTFPPDPPVVAIVVEYGNDTSVFGSEVVVIASAGPTVMLKFCVAVE